MPLSPTSSYENTEHEEAQRHSRMSQPESASSASHNRPTGAGVDTGAGTTREKTQAEIEADQKYDEAMEEEYAKREGGA